MEREREMYIERCRQRERERERERERCKSFNVILTLLVSSRLVSPIDKDKDRRHLNHHKPNYFRHLGATINPIIFVFMT